MMTETDPTAANTAAAPSPGPSFGTGCSSLAFDQRAAFVAGQAKSGTTLLVALLDGHPELLALPEETAYFPTVLTKYGGKSRREQFDYLTRQSLAGLLFGGRCKWGRRDAAYAGFPRTELLARFEALAFQPSNARRDLLALLLQAYAATLGRPLGSVARWIEKTPANRNHLPAIREKFPAAKILLTVRDPRAVFAARIALEETRRTRRFSAWLCVAHWRAAARLALGETPEPAGEKQARLVVPYERLAADPAAWLARACEFLEVAADPDTVGSLLTPTKAGLPWSGNSATGAHFDAVTVEPVNRWRHYLTRDEIGWIEWHCRDLMPRLGYTPLLPRRALRHWARPARGETAREYLKSRWQSLRN